MGLYDLDWLERMILRPVTRDFCWMWKPTVMLLMENACKRLPDRFSEYPGLFCSSGQKHSSFDHREYARGKLMRIVGRYQLAVLSRQHGLGFNPCDLLLKEFAYLVADFRFKTEKFAGKNAAWAEASVFDRVLIARNVNIQSRPRR